MGTNFYILGHAHDDSPKYHIGKRSAAGKYCWDCRQTFCKNGENGIHKGRSEWHDKCPKCGKKYNPEPLDKSSAGVELGFAKELSSNIGVTTVASFTWAMKPSQLLGIHLVVEDEYGHHCNLFEFTQIIRDMCPIEFYDSIGQEFC